MILLPTNLKRLPQIKTWQNLKWFLLIIEVLDSVHGCDTLLKILQQLFTRTRINLKLGSQLMVNGSQSKVALHSCHVVGDEESSKKCNKLTFSFIYSVPSLPKSPEADLDIRSSTAVTPPPQCSSRDDTWCLPSPSQVVKTSCYKLK